MASGKGGGKGSGGGGAGSSTGNTFAGQDLAKILNLSGGAMIGAALLFGGKKLYDYMSSGPVASGATPLTTPVTTPDYIKNIPDVVPEVSFGMDQIPKIEITCEGEECKLEGCGSPEQKLLGESATGSSSADESHSDTSPQSPSGGNSLHKQLLMYHTEVCTIPEHLLMQAQAIRDELLYKFGQYIAELLPNVPVHRLRSAAFDPQVVSVRQVEIRIPLDVNTNLWEIVDAGDSVLVAHGYCFVKRCNLEFFSPGSSRFDRYLIAGYLNPAKVRAVFQELTHRVGKWSVDHVPDMQVKTTVVGNVVQLTVQNPQGHTLQVSFVPEIILGDRSVVAEAHPISHLDTSYENLWRCCYGNATLQRLQQTVGCQHLCLQMLLGLQRLHALVGELGSHIPMATILHLLNQEDDWSEEALSERFIDSLKFIEAACQKRELVHPMNNRWNLLKHVRPTCLAAVAGLIQDVIEHKSYDWFLQED